MLARLTGDADDEAHAIQAQAKSTQPSRVLGGGGGGGGH